MVTELWDLFHAKNLLKIIEQYNLNIKKIHSYSIASDISTSGQHAIIAQGKKVIAAAEKWYSRDDRNLKREAVEWQDINDRANNGKRFLTEYWQLMITAPTESIDIVRQNLVSLYNINNFRLSVSSNLQLPAMLSMLSMQQA